MKKLHSIIALACFAFIMQACRNHTASNAADSTTTAKTDVTTDSTTKMTTIAADTGDVAFVDKAASGGMTEIALSKVAIQKSTNSKIKDFANMMVTDHSKAGDELAAIAKSKNITMPTDPDADQQNVISDLSAKTGSDFDKAYVKQMITDHKKTVDMFRVPKKL